MKSRRKTSRRKTSRRKTSRRSFQTKKSSLNSKKRKSVTKRKNRNSFRSKWFRQSISTPRNIDTSFEKDEKDEEEEKYEMRKLLEEMRKNRHKEKKKKPKINFETLSLEDVQGEEIDFSNCGNDNKSFLYNNKCYVNKLGRDIIISHYSSL